MCIVFLDFVPEVLLYVYSVFLSSGENMMWQKKKKKLECQALDSIRIVPVNFLFLFFFEIQNA